MKYDNNSKYSSMLHQRQNKRKTQKTQLLNEKSVYTSRLFSVYIVNSGIGGIDLLFKVRHATYETQSATNESVAIC